MKQDQWHKCLTSNTVPILATDRSSVLDFLAFCALRHKLAERIIRGFLSMSRCGLMTSAFSNCQLWVMLGKSLGLTEDLAGMAVRNWLSVAPGGMQQQCQGATWRGSTTGSAIV